MEMAAKKFSLFSFKLSTIMFFFNSSENPPPHFFFLAEKMFGRTSLPVSWFYSKTFYLLFFSFEDIINFVQNNPPRKKVESLTAIETK